VWIRTVPALAWSWQNTTMSGRSSERSSHRRRRSFNDRVSGDGHVSIKPLPSARATGVAL